MDFVSGKALLKICGEEKINISEAMIRRETELFGVSLDDLANFEPEENMGAGVPPKGKHMFGLVTVGDKGQIVIPAKARKMFDISPGDQLVILGEEGQGLAAVKPEYFLSMADMINNERKDQGR